MDAKLVRDKILKLRFMSGLSSDIQDRLAYSFQKAGRSFQIGPNTRLYTQGEQGSNDGYVLLEGEITVSKDYAPEVVCQAPELIGEMKQFSPAAQRTATVESTTELDVLQFKWADFDEALNACMSDEEAVVVREALQTYAWEHFTQ